MGRIGEAFVAWGFVASLASGCAVPQIGRDADVAEERESAVDGVRILEAPSGLALRFEAEGTHLRIRDEHEISIGVTAIGRAGEARRVHRRAHSITGTEVRRVLDDEGLVEWWRSSPQGLEHGLSIRERPGGEGPLRIEVGVEGELMARALSDDAASLVDESGKSVARYSHLVVLDADEVTIPARIFVIDGSIVLEINDASARYPLLVDPLVALEEALLPASMLAADDLFGNAVALSSDGSLALVGATFDDTSAGGEAGSARVFARAGTAWTEEAILLPTVPGAGDVFGDSVALSADGTRALIGAPGNETSAGTNAGSAHVFLRGGTGWVEEATLTASSAAAFDLFGQSVAISGDGSRVLVGAPGDDTATGSDRGSVRVFVRSSTSWTEEAMLEGPDGRFGRAVAISDDGLRALVGGSGSSARAWVFVRSASTWMLEDTLRPASATSSDYFGSAVAISPDGNTALVGAYRATTASGALAGRANVFTRTGSLWSEEATLQASLGAAGDEFGFSVALSADGSLALVGTHLDDTSAGIDSGSCRIFERVGTLWTEVGNIVPPGVSAADRFGNAVALSADGSRALVGAIADDTPAGMDSGSARVLLLVSTGNTCTAASDCLGGFCVDGVCCESACGGSAVDCQACSVADGGTTDGRCTPLTPAMAAARTCRSSAGDCDVAETCSAVLTECPPDAFAATGTVCRAATDVCDVAESCSGVDAACPVDELATLGVLCRARAGPCDVPERCTGTGRECPTDRLAPVTTTCRAPGGPCDVAEQCTGTGPACPADALAADGTSCADVNSCDGTESCMAGSCTSGTPADCDDGDICTVDSCDPATGCLSEPVVGCCMSDMDCDDGDACTRDTCRRERRACLHDRIADCTAAEADAGTIDGGVATGDHGGCGCSAPGGTNPMHGPLAGLFMALLAFRTWRRRQSSQPRSSGS